MNLLLESIAPTDEELLLIRCPLAPEFETTSPETNLPGTLGDRPNPSSENDWFELALQTEAPAARPVINSWGDDDEEGDEEIPDEDAPEEEDEDPDPFEDFDEEDFDDDFDDDFEEELDDEYEIEPKDDGFAAELGEDSDEDLDDADVDEDEI